jgi:hypothetical protein
MQYVSAETLVHEACEHAIRWRLRDIEEHPVQGDPSRLHTKRASLDLLHMAFQEGRLDPIQRKLLEQLLNTYDEQLHDDPLPDWPGAEAAHLRHWAEEHAAVEVAREHLRAKHDAA